MIIRNPKFNPNDPQSQEYIFDRPTIINQNTGQLSDTLTGEDLKLSPDLNITNPDTISFPDVKNIPVTEPPQIKEEPTSTAGDLTSRLNELQNKLLGKPVAEQATITERTADFTRSLNELNTQIKLHQANALARQEEALKSGETLRFASGTAQNIARTDAIEAMKLSALAQGMQGNIMLAENQAKNAVETEFAKVKQDIQTARQNILNNYDTFTAAEKKRADATLLSLDEKDAFVARQTSDREQSYKLSIEAAKKGLTNIKLLTQIQNSNPLEAANLAAPYLAEKEKPLIKDFEVGGRLKRQVLDPMTGRVISETDLGEKGEDKTYTDKTLPGRIRQDIISTLTDKEGAKELGKELKLTDLMTIFPEVDRETLQSYMDDFYDYETLILEEGATKKKWYEFWK